MTPVAPTQAAGAVPISDSGPHEARRDGVGVPRRRHVARRPQPGVRRPDAGHREARRRRHPVRGLRVQPPARQAAGCHAERRPDADLGGEPVAVGPPPPDGGPRPVHAGRPVQPAKAARDPALRHAEQAARLLRQVPLQPEHIDAIITALYQGQDELQRDNASIEQEKANLWTSMGRLRQYSYLAQSLDAELTAKIASDRGDRPDRATRPQGGHAVLRSGRRTRIC